MIIFESDVECTECSGTGLYKGYAEGGKSAVICRRCEGSGMIHIKHEYKEFSGRKMKDNVDRVYKTSAGYGITDRDITTEEGKLFKFSEAGISYRDWLRGGEPKPIKDLHCPLQHFSQGTDMGEMLKNIGPCSKYLHIGDSISECCKEHREECWETLHKTGMVD